ncbi:MAG: hypothetical protein II117_08425 [Clostridia bacterium]|nr:hypothetical protein [Clostridia bacterium]
MSRKQFFIILAALCLLAAIGVVVFGTVRSISPVEVKDLGLITLELDMQNEIIVQLQEGKKVDAVEPDENGEYTICYRSMHPQYGEIRYLRSIDKDELSYFAFNLANEKPTVNYDGEPIMPDENETSAFDKKIIERYVYAYSTPQGYEFMFFDSHQTVDRVTTLIDEAPKVSTTRYYIVAGILLLGGAYLLFLAFAGKRTTAPKQS